MRVLDPRVKNPIYKLHDKAAHAIGDGGTIAAITTVGVLAPVGGGFFIDSLIGLASAVGWYGLITFRGYKKHTSNKKRVTEMMRLKSRIDPEYHYVVDPMIAEIFHCDNQHFDFRIGEKNLEYVHTVTANSYSCQSRSIPEGEREWKAREIREHILHAGFGCKFCGERIMATRELAQECESAKIEDDNSVQAARAVLDSKRRAKELVEGFSALQSDAQAEITAMIERGNHESRRR